MSRLPVSLAATDGGRWLWGGVKREGGRPWGSTYPVSDPRVLHRWGEVGVGNVAVFSSDNGWETWTRSLVRQDLVILFYYVR